MAKIKGEVKRVDGKEVNLIKVVEALEKEGIKFKGKIVDKYD